MSQEIDEVKKHVAVGNRILAELGLASHILISLGHVSMRVPNQPDLFVVKGRGYEIDALSMVTPEQMIVVNMEGEMVDGPMGTGQCREVKMHSCILRENPDVQSVVHVHPRFTVLMSLLGIQLQAMCNEGARLVKDEIPVYEHSRLILSDNDGMAVVNAMGTSKAVLLRGHGAATAGKSMEEAVMTMLQLEEQARLNYFAYCAMGPNYSGIAAAEIDEASAESAAMRQLPHLAGPLSRGAAPGTGGRPGGLWAYYSHVVSGDL
jgi:ribulose-5-phosphate 4-epimerase/fuculose-1-phosphate aldolase